MKHLGACLQRLPWEERFYRHQPSSQLQPTFRPEWQGVPARPLRSLPGVRTLPARAAHLPPGPEPEVSSGLAGCVGAEFPNLTFLDGLQKGTSVVEFQGKVLIGAVQSRGEKCYAALFKASPCMQINIKMARV